MQVRAFGMIFDSQENYCRFLDCKQRWDDAEERVKDIESVDNFLMVIFLGCIATGIGLIINALCYFTGH